MKSEIDILVEELLASVQPEYPKDHVAGMRVPKGGSNCAKCEYLADNQTDCTNEYFQKWNGGPVIPGKIDEYCSDWFEAKEDLEAAGTSEGVRKAWDTRGRGRKPRPLGAPRMRNRIQRERPHDPKSAIGQVMDMAQREQGVRVEEAKEFLKAKGVRLWVISFVRAGEGNGFRWQVIDDGKKSGVIRVGKPEKIPDEELARMAQKEQPALAPVVEDNKSKASYQSEIHLLTSPVSDSHELGGGMNPSRVVDFGDGTKGVFKPDYGVEGEDDRTRPNIPRGQDTEREVAAWQVAKLVGMDDMVSPAVIRTIDGERGALLAWQEGKVAFQKSEPYDGEANAQRAAIFDFVIGNEDRHAGNWIVEDAGSRDKLHLIDHGLSFPEGEWDHWYNAKFIDHVRYNNGRPNADVVAKYVKAAPMISKTLKVIGLNDDVIKGVNRRIDILKSAQGWMDVDDESGE